MKTHPPHVVMQTKVTETIHEKNAMQNTNITASSTKSGTAWEDTIGWKTIYCIWDDVHQNVLQDSSRQVFFLKMAGWKCSRQNVPAKCVFEIVPAKCVFKIFPLNFFWKIPAKCFLKMAGCKCSRQYVPAKCVFEIVPAKCVFKTFSLNYFWKIPAKCFFEKVPAK